MSCEVRIVCLYKPVHGKIPDKRYCDMHDGCFMCPYQHTEYVDSESKKSKKNKEG